MDEHRGRKSLTVNAMLTMAQATTYIHYGWVDDYRTALSVHPIYLDPSIMANNKPYLHQNPVF
jgi:hypothetical protein